MISQGISIQSFSLSYTQSSTDQQDFRSNIKSLIDAIKNGDLQGAKDAYAKISDALNSSSTQNDTSGTDTSGTGTSDDTSESPFTALLESIGKSLSSDDIAGAQKSLSDFEANRPKGGHHQGGQPAFGLSGDAQNALIDLVKSLRSDDLSGAKDAYTKLQDQKSQDAQQNQSLLDTFLSQVGTALNNEDLDAANTALQDLAQQRSQGVAVDFSA
jgi:ribosomal protein S20